MIGVGIAFIALGIALLFVIPWVGIPIGVVGLVLALLYFAGFGRRAASPRRSSGDARQPS
jgi:hypothetical protein